VPITEFFGSVSWTMRGNIPFREQPWS
jgi:hypothetical protein